MDFAFTDEQTMLRESIARYLEKNYAFETRQEIVRSEKPFSPEVWKFLTELGIPALPFSEELGGFGGSAVDLVAIGEIFGEYLLVEPYVSTVLLAGRALATASEHQQAREWLERIVAGDALAAFAHEEGAGTPEPARVALRAERSGATYRLDGEKRLVLGGADADVLVVTARISGEPGQSEGLALLLVDPTAPGIEITPFTAVDGRSAAHLRFGAVEVPAENLLTEDAHAAITGTLDEGLIGLAAEAVGSMGVLLRQTSEYATTRKQFGVPILTFQSIAHRLADMKIAYTKARASLLYTAALAESGRLTPRAISVLKAQVGRLGRELGESAVQIHGGVGMTDELAVGHHLKRLLAVDTMFGDSDYHYRIIGAA